MEHKARFDLMRKMFVGVSMKRPAFVPSQAALLALDNSWLPRIDPLPIINAVRPPSGEMHSLVTVVNRAHEHALRSPGYASAVTPRRVTEDQVFGIFSSVFILGHRMAVALPEERILIVADNWFEDYLAMRLFERALYGRRALHTLETEVNATVRGVKEENPDSYLRSW